MEEEDDVGVDDEEEEEEERIYALVHYGCGMQNVVWEAKFQPSINGELGFGADMGRLS